MVSIRYKIAVTSHMPLIQTVADHLLRLLADLPCHTCLSTCGGQGERQVAYRVLGVRQASCRGLELDMCLATTTLHGRDIFAISDR